MHQVAGGYDDDIVAGTGRLHRLCQTFCGPHALPPHYYGDDLGFRIYVLDERDLHLHGVLPCMRTHIVRYELPQPHRYVFMDLAATERRHVFLAAHDALVRHTVVVGTDDDIGLRKPVLGYGSERIGGTGPGAQIARMRRQDGGNGPSAGTSARLPRTLPEALGYLGPQYCGIGRIERPCYGRNAHEKQ